MLDVGGDASRFVDALIGRRFRDVTVLDISSTGMRYAQRRLGVRADRVQWVVADLLTWQPPRRYRAWHDRAVFAQAARLIAFHNFSSLFVSASVSVLFSAPESFQKNQK